MGSKNRILLAMLTNLILHKLRNIFDTKELYITKAKLKKVEQKHQQVVFYLYDNNFQTILDNTIGICAYKHDDSIYNFVSIINDDIFLYSISTNNHFNYIGTFFKTDKRKLLKQCNDNIKFLNSKKRKAFEDFI